jgi:hypothetical protein
MDPLTLFLGTNPGARRRTGGLVVGDAFASLWIQQGPRSGARACGVIGILEPLRDRAGAQILQVEADRGCGWARSPRMAREAARQHT